MAARVEGMGLEGGKPVANVELWQALEAAVARHESVTWEWVKGHAGDALNERVDRIASGEAERQPHHQEVPTMV
jgi:ribonuclease HI